MSDRPFTTPDKGVEARAEPRVPVRWRGQVVTADGRRLAVQIVDISSGGAGLIGEDKMVLHQPVLLEGQVPRLPDMDGYVHEKWQATVAFQSFQGGSLRTGVKFKDISPAQQAHLRAWITRRAHAW
jgi:c-di-GMP-binding flagellar brake protein YcgR